ncbi:MAG: hypothetical protein QM796_16565 [Chthoniobacteraceae bacterium]
MPPWLLVWIIRWISGERFRKATPEDYRYHFGAFFWSGVFMIFGTVFGEHFLDHASAVSLWMAAVVSMSVLLCCTLLWARLVPAAVSLGLAVVAWGAFVWLALRATQVL